MEPTTTIKDMLKDRNICVPSYQRAYSWDKDKQVKQFLIDVDDYLEKNSNTPYYFGHFIFEKNEDKFNIIDGQQRLTTIEIFLSTLFKKIKSVDITNKLNEEEKEKLEMIEKNTIKRKSKYIFSTVEYDNQFFRDYVIDQNITNKNNITTQSCKRIAEAFDFFVAQLENKKIDDLRNYIKCITESVCTTHIVNSEIEAVAMFIFQNNRGKEPTNLEIIKAQFMYEIQTSKSEDKDDDIKTLQNRFRTIYETINKIENYINEDDVLLYALRVYFDDLGIDVSMKKIESKFKEDNKIKFIMEFALELQESFLNLQKFFTEEEYEIYSFALLKRNQMLPFVIKAYKFDISTDDKKELFKSLKSIILRHRIIGTRAHLEDRIKTEFKDFTNNNKDIKPIISRINNLKNNNDWWWKHWSNENLEWYLKEELNHNTAKYLLWLYENHLLSQEKQGYNMRFEAIKEPEIEHIAPKTPTNNEPIAAGYCEYDDEFKQKYLNCLGNYLLISKSHNCSIGNVPFEEKRKTYKMLAQHREIQNMTENNNPIWDKEKIEKRNEKIIKFLLEVI